jgi:3-oxoacyl-[acyl-carrier protein] reductase
MELGLGGRVALVAGASAGLGYAVARELAREGARVVIASRDRARIEAAAAALRRETSGEVHPVVVDVLDPRAGQTFVAAARSAFGAPGILVTNAGGPPPGPFAELTPEAFQAAVELNFLSAVRLTHAVLPHLVAAGWGRLVHIASGTVFEPSVALFLSSSVRPAVVGFSKALSREVAAKGVTSNVVCPGLIATERLAELAEDFSRRSGRTPQEEMAGLARSSPAGRIGRPEELGKAVAFLCSEAAAYINGVALRVDGGRAAYIL